MTNLKYNVSMTLNPNEYLYGVLTGFSSLYVGFELCVSEEDEYTSKMVLLRLFV